MNVSLTPRLEEFVRGRVASGLYGNASEVVREALRRLVEREDAGANARRKAVPSKDEMRAELAALEKPLRERGLASLALFGSIVRGEARSDSDIDVLVDVDPKVGFSLVDLVSVKLLLENRLGRKVDVVTRQGIEPAVWDRVLNEAESVF